MGATLAGVGFGAFAGSVLGSTLEDAGLHIRTLVEVFMELSILFTQ